MSKDIRIDVDIDFTEYIGGIIDAPLEEFSATIERDRVPVGVLLNTKVLLIGMFNELCARKDALIDRVRKGTLSEDNVIDVIKGIYSEMIKIEAKVLYLVKRIDELQDVG